MGIKNLLGRGDSKVRTIRLKADGKVEVGVKGAVPRLQFQDIGDAEKNIEGVLYITCPEVVIHGHSKRGL